MNRRWTVAAVGVLALGCFARSPNPPAPAAVVDVRLDHLRRLGLDATVSGRRVRAVAVYAEAPDYRPIPSPMRDGSEGIACVDDAARAAVLYLRHFERTGDGGSLDEARGLLAFVTAMEQGDGEYVNFIRGDGTPNRTSSSSRKSFSYWAARALWALGEGARVLGPRDPVAAAALRPALDRTVVRLAREAEAGRLVAGAATATAEALLGLLAYQRADPSPERARLAACVAELLVPLSRDDPETPRWGAHADAPGAVWHAWGARSVEAFGSAALVLDRPDLVAAARREADHLWVRFLLGGDVPAEVSSDGSARPFPQIAYGVGPIVDGYLALAEATGDRRYAVLAGLAGSWFLGGNRAGVPLYDEATGRAFDGLDGPAPSEVNRNAGAESTVEALLALSAAAADPDAAPYLRYLPDGPTAAPADAPSRRDFVGPSGERVRLAREGASFRVEERGPGGEAIELAYWPAANPTEVRLATRLADAWNADHPTAQVRVQPIPAGRSSEEVLLAAIVGRATPDLCSNVSSALLARLVRARGVVRLDRAASTTARLAERATPAMLDPLRLPDGGVYAIPWKTNPLMLMYNVEQLEEAGVRPPRTHGELLDALRRLARDTDGNGRLDRWGMWAPLRTMWFERFFDFYPLYLAGSGGRTLIPGGEVAFENKAAVAAFDVFRRAFAEGLLPRANFEGRDPFVDGTVAMKLVGPFFLWELEQMKVRGLRYAVVPVPVPDGASPDAAFAFTDLKSLAVFSTTRYPDAATRFAAYLTSPEADRLLVEDTAQLPYRRSLDSDPRFAAALARWPTLPAYARLVERGRDVDVHPDVVEVFDILSEAYEASAIYDTVPPEAAIHEAAREVRSLLRGR